MSEMVTFKKNTCRLCLATIKGKYFNIDEITTTAVLDIPLLVLKNEDGSKHVVCNICYERLSAAVVFKSTCLNANNTIISYADCKKLLQIDLREVYLKEKEGKLLLNISLDQKVCWLCMQLVSNQYQIVRDEELKAIRMFLPEINTSVVKDPVVCMTCFNSLCTHNDFLNDCAEVFKKSQAEAWPLDSFIKTENLDEFRKNEMELTIKTECVDIKVEGEFEREAPLVTDNLLADSVYQCNFSQGNNHLAHDDSSTSDIRIHQCDTCGFSCKQKYSLKRHMLKHVSGNQKFQCEVCDYKTKYKNNLKAHQLKHKDISETEVFECNTCDFKTKYKYGLESHLLKHKDVSETEIFDCDKCTFKTRYKNTLKMHILTHKDISETEVFECDTCDYITKRKRNLTLHLRLHKDDSEREVFQCDTCNYKTTRKGNLKAHVLTHKDMSRTEVFECEECDYKTKRKGNLTIHLQRHKNISKSEFQCGTCNYKTKHKKNLVSHLMTHKDVSEIKVFQCDTCDYETIRKDHLKNHHLRHTKFPEMEVFKCNACGYKTNFKKGLTQHQLAHKHIPEMELMKCDMCDYKTKLKDTLRKHKLRQHSQKESGTYVLCDCQTGYTHT